MKRSRKFLVVLLALAIFAVGISTSPAGAKPKARIYWSPAATANEDQPVRFIWRGKYFGRHYKVVVQRPVGTSHVWKGIMQLDASGNGTLPGMKLGVHWFRIAVFSGSKLIAQQVKVIKVFGTVPFTKFLDDETPSVFTAPTVSFAYVRSAYVSEHPQTLFGVSNNNCSSVHVAFLEHAEYQHSGIGTVTIVQQSQASVSGSATFDTVGSVDATLVPGQTWGLNADFTLTSLPHVYINGYATCYSTEPFHE